MEKKKLFQHFVHFTTAVHQESSDITKDINIVNITPLQYKILEFITVSQPVTLSQISECLHISLPNSSRELKKLMESQLCEKGIDPIDRRKSDISLTEKGTTLMNEVFQQIEEKFLERINHFSETELHEIEQAMQTLQKKLFM